MSNHKLEIRKIQALQGERSFTLVLPKGFATALGLEKGDYVKVVQDEKRIIIEKADMN